MPPLSYVSTVTTESSDNETSPARDTDGDHSSTEHHRISYFPPPRYQSFPLSSTLELLHHQLFIIQRVRFQQRLASYILHVEAQETFARTVHILPTQKQMLAQWVPSCLDHPSPYVAWMTNGLLYHVCDCPSYSTSLPQKLTNGHDPSICHNTRHIPHTPNAYFNIIFPCASVSQDVN